MSETRAQLTIDRLFSDPDLGGTPPQSVAFSPDGARITWLAADTDNFERLDLWEHDIASGQTHCLVKSSDIASTGELSDAEKAYRERRRITQSGIVEYYWHPDGNSLLFPLDGNLFLYDLASASSTQLTGEQTFETSVQFSPDGRYLSFVRDQDLWLIQLESGHEIRLTFDGGGTTSNGVAEFIAQEEMHRFHGYWWSPDSQWIAFSQVDESPVELTQRYEIAADGFSVHDQRYPFAGTPNAIARLGIVDLSGEARWLGVESDASSYIARVNWLSDNRRVAVQLQSRDQQKLQLLVVDHLAASRRVVLEESSETWLNLNDDFRSLSNPNHLIWGSEQDGYNHLYRVDATTGEKTRITSGDGPVTRLLSVDEEAGLVYFEGYVETPLECHLYSARIDGTSPPSRITESGFFHQVSMAADHRHFVDRYSSAVTPIAVRLCNMEGNVVHDVFANNLDASHPFSAYLHCRGESSFGELEASDGQTLHYQLIRPNRAGKCPVIVLVYGGPGVQRVTNEWIQPWQHYMASRGYGILRLDNRGSTHRGTRFEAPIFRHLGVAEVQDQLQGVALLKSLPWVDADRIGVFGHSYGGYMTLMLLAKAPGVFRCGVSVAPVTDWRLYDTHYTERYLGDPNENGQGYEASSVFPYAGNLSDNLLLIHGMADDNVLFTHSTKLMKSLQDAGVEFEMMAYPGAKHGLSGRLTNIHRYTLMDRFFDRHLGGNP